MQRYGEVIKVKPEKLKEYKRLHDNIWPIIVEKIYNANIRNFSIFYRDNYLFKYFEYIGDDFEADMEKLNNDSENLKWLACTDPCQIPVETAEKGEWWAPMELIFHI